ncbi:MAG: hypothetical protein CSA64_04125 [Arachnia propionica]|nr:MAG: hypothetical protein CSA64_04125 [Arachnia propionica]
MTGAQAIELAFSLFFAVGASILVATQAALSTMSKARAERLVQEKAPGASQMLRFAQESASTINTVMLARMALEITTITLISLLCYDLLQANWQRVLVTVAIMLVVSFIMWGVAPRTIGQQQPEATLRFAGPLVAALRVVLGPITKLMVLLGNKLTPGKGYAEGPFASEAELRDFVDLAEANELIEAEESKMIHSVFELGDTRVKELMVPRTDMVFISQDKSLRELMSLALRSGFSRIPVVGEGIDDLLGVVYLKDVARRIFDFPDAERNETVADLMRSATFVPDTKPAADLLRDMQLRHSHLVIVVDEFGGTAGLATMEDIVEEIVGEIVDEYDADLPTVEELEPGYYRVPSRLELDELGELFGMDIDDEDVETVGGLLAKQLNLVPIPGSRATFGELEMVADQAFGRRRQVGTVLVRKLSELEAANGQH